MPHYQLIEGEGVAGPLHAVTAETTALLSCMAVVMFNKEKNIAGLYHYGANTIEKKPTENSIVNMFNDIGPQKISVSVPPIAARNEFAIPKATEDDRRKLKVTLNAIALFVPIEWIRDVRRCRYWVDKGELFVDDSVSDQSRIICMKKQYPNFTGRKVVGHTCFYRG